MSCEFIGADNRLFRLVVSQTAGLQSRTCSSSLRISNLLQRVRVLDLSPLGWLAVVFPVASSIVFFILGRDLPVSRRIFASIHGVAALAILPLTFLAMAIFTGIGETSGTVLMLVVGGVAGTSIFYAISVVRARWYVHLLHVPTLAVIAGGFVFARFLLYGH